MARHEVDAFGRHVVGGQDQVAFVFPVFLVDEDHHAASGEFGDQLIDEDWTLTFPPADPTLAQVERRAIDEARQRLAWLAEVRPVRQARPPQQYRAAPTRGGVVADGGPSVLGDQSRWEWSQGRRGAGTGAGVGGGTGSGGNTAGGSGTGRRHEFAMARSAE
jgi:hypothetical protein